MTTPTAEGGKPSVQIAVVQAMCGHLTCVGPDDFKKADYSNAMDAAIGWHIEAGYMPAATYWIEAELPPHPVVQTVRAHTKGADNA